MSEKPAVNTVPIDTVPINTVPAPQPSVQGVRTPGGDRVQRSREAVLRVTSELLTERGLGGVSVDEVSRRSGVAKTTIYRHWPARSDLLIDACSQITTQQTTQQEVPDIGNFEGDLTALLTTMATLLSTARWSSVLPSIIDAAERDPELASIHGQIQRGHAAPFLEIVARAVRKGELPATTDSAALVASVLGPLFYRRWFSREPLDDQFLQGVIDNICAKLLCRTRQGGDVAAPAEGPH
jgi:AcrR family transcriptional regulator